MTAQVCGQGSDRVRLERDGAIAVIVIDNPPVNAGSAAVREALRAAVRIVESDDAIEGAVILGAGTTFVAGSDIREFGKPLQEPQLPAVLEALAASRKPFVAAIHGAALGGGFELALGCDARIAAHDAVVGLPEVTLGMIPGAGGTQHVPRVAGLAAAIDIIGSGRRVKADEALRLGLIDAVAHGDLRAAALSHVRALRGRKRRLRDEAVPPEAPEAIAAAERAVLQAGRNRPHVAAAIAAIRTAASLPYPEALARERTVFQELRNGREAAALRHLFFAEREAPKVPGLEGVQPREIRRVGIVGAGALAAGIAIAFADTGVDVILVDTDGAALDRLDSADLVIEAGFEDLAIKQELFARLDAIAAPGALLATHTSCLDVNAIAAATSRPGDVLGMHFSSPANVMRLLEIVRADATGADAIATALAVGRTLRKVCVVARGGRGFIGNRIFAAYRQQAELMVEEGASREAVDAAIEAFGFAMGPFAVADLAGPDIAWRNRRRQASTRDPRAFTAEEIRGRVLLAIVNEAALLLGEGIAQRASDVDVVLVNGYGFPRHEGGPLFWAARQDPGLMRARLEELAQVCGPGFRRGPVEALLSGLGGENVSS
jgi:3-hydroxyacyl-CoA dehydrogenase